jgi:hypothetical protein
MPADNPRRTAGFTGKIVSHQQHAGPAHASARANRLRQRHGGKAGQPCVGDFCGGISHAPLYLVPLVGSQILRKPAVSPAFMR